MAEPLDQVVLVGAPGSGKTTVGRLLAERLGLPLIDVDERIVAAVGSPITDIFADRGEAAFRALEREHTLAALDANAVLSLGGGAVAQPAVREALAGRRVVWLVISAAVAADRVGLNVARPLLLGNVRGTLVRLLAERTPLYAAAARHRVETDTRTPEEVTDAIVALLEAEPA